jgi:hypothetical protein
MLQFTSRLAPPPQAQVAKTNQIQNQQRSGHFNDHVYALHIIGNKIKSNPTKTVESFSNDFVEFISGESCFDLSQTIHTMLERLNYMQILMLDKYGNEHSIMNHFENPHLSLEQLISQFPSDVRQELRQDPSLLKKAITMYQSQNFDNEKSIQYLKLSLEGFKKKSLKQKST